jgi:hypothetical protein
VITSTSRVVTRATTRVFLIEGRADPTHHPDYQSTMIAGAPSWDQGSVTAIEMPDPERYEHWIEADVLLGTRGPAGMELRGRYARTMLSTMRRLARVNCPLDVQVHIGLCSDPRAFNTYRKILVFENAAVADASLSELGALSSEGNAAIDDMLSLAAMDVYEVVNIVLEEVTDWTVV